MPRTGNAHDAQVTKLMAALKEHTAKLGAPEIEGGDAVGGKDAPALYFGLTKMNNNVAVVDEVVEAGGKGAAATLFDKDGDECRARCNHRHEARQSRTWPGPALDALKTGKAYNGDASVFGTPYIAGYEPITDSSSQTIGAYFAGCKK